MGPDESMVSYFGRYQWALLNVINSVQTVSEKDEAINFTQMPIGMYENVREFFVGYITKE